MFAFLRSWLNGICKKNTPCHSSAVTKNEDSEILPAIEPLNCKKAAMALNLCTASISRIIDSQDMEVMEQEYDAILNNLNLQNIIKDETLLTTMRSILDTISFYRLQQGDKKRMETRYQHRLNSAIWDSAGSVNLMVIGSNYWAAAAAAAIQLGTAYVNYRRSKSSAQLDFDDETWRLERSAIEQLHALRCSLFETAWRLSDTYDFPDEWRLTVKQVNQYNAVLAEANSSWRYAKLEQYKSNFMAYPYFWYELAEAAFQAALENDKNKTFYLEKAEDALNTFICNNQKLLRQDIIGASAIIRYTQLLQQKNGKWSEAIGRTEKQLADVVRLACDAPDLLMNAALCYCAANAEVQNAKYAEHAIHLLEMLVNQNYNIPTTSRLLSKLYLELKKDQEYKVLKSRVGSEKVVSENQKMNEMLAPDWQALQNSCRELFYNEFIVALKISHGNLFNCPFKEVNGRIENWLKEEDNGRDKNVKETMRNFWDKSKGALNEQMVMINNALALDKVSIAKIAGALDETALHLIDDFSGTGYLGKIASQENTIIHQQKALNTLISKLHLEFVERFTNLIEKTFFLKRFSDFSEFDEGISNLRDQLARQIKRNGIIDISITQEQEESVNFFEFKIPEDKKTFPVNEYSPKMIVSLVQKKQSFEITDVPLPDLFKITDDIEKQILHLKKTVRICTAGRSIIANAFLLPPFTGIGMCLHSFNALHNLCTFDPDYEITRYPSRIVVTSMREVPDSPFAETPQESSSSTVQSQPNKTLVEKGKDLLKSLNPFK